MIVVLEKNVKLPVDLENCFTIFDYFTMKINEFEFIIFGIVKSVGVVERH